ncbi:MAG TPA: phage head closure protein [Devosiaceae bacterium]|nr:phage head closure protein [Devosiaceae bacterium]
MSALAEVQKPPIGSLRDRVEIRRRDTVADDGGGTVTTFFPIATVWARVRELSARQASWGDARGSSLTHSVVLRYRIDIGPGDRLVFLGRNLEVVGAEDLNGRRTYLSCTCVETMVTG